jgi:hypothetical protein
MIERFLKQRSGSFPRMHRARHLGGPSASPGTGPSVSLSGSRLHLPVRSEHGGRPSGVPSAGPSAFPSALPMLVSTFPGDSRCFSQVLVQAPLRSSTPALAGQTLASPSSADEPARTGDGPNGDPGGSPSVEPSSSPSSSPSGCPSYLTQSWPTPHQVSYAYL